MFRSSSRLKVVAIGVLIGCSSDTALTPSGSDTSRLGGLPPSSALAFPIHRANLGPRNAEIRSVFDHSSPTFYQAGADNSVVAFTGVRSDQNPCGDPTTEYSRTSDNIASNALGTANISSASCQANHVAYDGHPGYDYLVPYDEPVYAAIDGQINYTDRPNGVLSVPASAYHALTITGQNGLKVRYLHLSSWWDGSQMQHRRSDGKVVSCSECAQPGTTVSASSGKLVGYVGTFSPTKEFPNGTFGGVGPHLHFEVEQSGKPIDPYGWQGGCPDPAGGGSRNLWDNSSSAPSAAFSATVGSKVFADCQSAVLGDATASVPLRVTLDAAQSASGTASTLTAFEWIVDGKSAGGAPSFVQTFAPGKHRVSLTVKNSEGAISAAEAEYGVNALPICPAASIATHRLLSSSIQASACPPTAPSNLLATAVSATSVSLTWKNTTTDQDSVRIDRCPNSACSISTQLAVREGGSTSYVDSGLQPTTPYTYRVRAWNSVGNSPYSASASATTPALAFAPKPPTLSVAPVSSSQLSVTWTRNSNDETGFLLDRCVGVGCGVFTTIANPAAGSTSYPDVGLLPATSYSYRIRAYNAAGNSDFSNTAIGTTPAATISPATNLVANVISSTEIDLAWVNNTSALDLNRVERCTGSGCTAFDLVQTVAGDATRFPDTGLSPSTSYVYRIVAIKGPSSATSATAGAATGASFLAPSGVTATAVSPSEIDIGWLNNSAADSLRVQRCQGASCNTFTTVTTVSGTRTGYQDTGLSSATSYSYRVVAITNSGKSATSAVATATTLTQGSGFAGVSAMLTATPNTIGPGGNAQLSWSSTSATTCLGYAGVSGSITVNPPSYQPYTILCYGSKGTGAGYADVSVGVPSGLPSGPYLVVNPNDIAGGTYNSPDVTKVHTVAIQLCNSGDAAYSWTAASNNPLVSLISTSGSVAARGAGVVWTCTPVLVTIDGRTSTPGVPVTGTVTFTPSAGTKFAQNWLNLRITFP
jgi:murein DD-endopeptidase MepM/ murein hydrolase activator NlpD